MLKLAATSTTLLASASASASKSSLKGHSYNSGLKAAFSEGTRSTQAQLDSAAAVAGAWYMETVAESRSCASTETFHSGGYKMGICMQNDDGQYAKYSCTEDSSTGDVVLSMTTYSDVACTAGPTVQPSVTYSTTCSGAGRAASCQDTNNYSADMAEFSNGGIFYSGFTSDSECSGGAATDVVAYAGNKGCDGQNLFYGSEAATEYSSADCTGPVVSTLSYTIFDQFIGNCQNLVNDDGDDVDDDDGIISYENIAISLQWTSDDGDDDCFHVESKIDYKGVEYTYEELKAGKEPECSIPHSPSSKGVVITTSCDNKTVRVTDTHLMATTKGFQLAYSLKAGDVLFGGYSNTDMCTVVSVEKEKTTQQYFGLNCVHSEVLASGLRASTFGDFHTLPSWYMTYVGGLVGTDAASTLGEYIAEWYFQKY